MNNIKYDIFRLFNYKVIPNIYYYSENFFSDHIQRIYIYWADIIPTNITIRLRALEYKSIWKNHCSGYIFFIDV